MKKILLLIMLVMLAEMTCKKNNNTSMIKGIVLQNKLSLQSGPDMASQVILQMNKGDLVSILDKTSEYYCLVDGKFIGRDDSSFKDMKYAMPWYKIEYKGKTGWVFGDYIGVELNNNFFSNVMYGEVYNYKDPSFNKYDGLKIEINNKKYILCFFIRNASPEDFDTVTYSINYVFIDTSNNTGIVNDNLLMHDSDTIKGIYQIKNTSRIIIYEKYCCDTCPCTGKSFRIFDIVKNDDVFVNSYLETGCECSDSELLKYIIIRDDKIIFNTIEYVSPEYNNPQKEDPCYYKYLTIYQEIYNRAADKVYLVKKTGNSTLSGKANKNLVLYNDPDMKEEEASLPVHSDVQIVKGKYLNFSDFENKDKENIIYIEGRDEKGWCYVSNITVYDEFFNNAIHSVKPVREIYNESHDVILLM